MKKIKKIFALALMLVMALTMNITAFATDDGEAPAGKSATISISGVGQGATMYYRQVIKADRTTKTGWAIVSGCEGAFANFVGDDAQAKIQSYIDTTSEAERIAKFNDISVTDTFSNPQTVTEAGLYYIKITEAGFTYSPMLAYVGFDNATGANKGLVDTKLKAKKTPDEIFKALDEQVSSDDHFVEIGEEVTYDIKVQVPYKPKNGTVEFTVSDELIGGVYKTEESGENQGKVALQLSLGDTPVIYATPTDEGTKFEVDLSFLLINDEDPEKDNPHANKDLIIKYTAIAKGIVIQNKAWINHKEKPAEVTSYTGKLKITKWNEVGSDEPQTLPGATFVVVNAAGKYAQLSNNVLVKWVDQYDSSCYIVTGDDGTATVSGFDPDITTYRFHEVDAPEGYALCEKDAVASWVLDQPDDDQIAVAEMHDTKLAQLPYTGGSGTAAFTGFGVLLMSVAAGLYFANKRNKVSK